MALRDEVDQRVLRIAEGLKTMLPCAIGIVESLRIFADSYTPGRLIGKYSNSEIAMSIFYDGDPDELMTCLERSGWVAPSDRGYILVGRSWKRGDKRTRRRDRMRAAGGDIRPSVRAFIFERDGRICKICLAVEDLTIDHIWPVAAGGTNEIANLQVLCRSCNSSKRDFTAMNYSEAICG